MLRHLVPLLFISAAGAADLTYVTSWVGNSFNGAGGNGSGRWMQNILDEIEVAPDGTVLGASYWDEAGRCSGLYRDGQVNIKLLQQYNGKGGHKAWGWGTAGQAVAFAGEQILIVNDEGDLMRFGWKPGDLDSATWTDEVKVGKAVGITARGQTVITVGVDGVLSVRALADLSETSRFTVSGARDVVIDAKDTLWILAGDQIIHRARDGAELAGTITDAGKPTSVAIDHQGKLIVCDDGPRQQVLFYELGATPKLVRRFGDEGGLRAGTPGVVTATKLWGLRGAGTDAAGNLYVGLNIATVGSRGTVLKAFSPDGQLKWELHSHGFVDCYSFDPASDGREIYGVDEILTLDPTKPPGEGWALKALTIDAIKHPDDPRITGRGGSAGILRRPQGRRLLATIAQMSGGIDLYTFESEQSHIARFRLHAGDTNGGWAWEIDEHSDIWRGDGPDNAIQRWRFQGWSADGAPQYDFAKPESWPRPEGFIEIGRVHYVPATDTLYIAGFTQEKKQVAWGTIGSIVVRYDGWSTGKPVKKWTADMPVDDEKLYPKSLDIAGDYLFTAAVKPTKGVSALVSVFSLKDGAPVGTMQPGPEVGGVCGWIDMSHGLRALRCSDGEYRLLVEEDFRGKNLLYRWTPGK